MNLLLSPVPITDTNCGYEAIRADALEGVLAMVIDYKGSFDADLLMRVDIFSKEAAEMKSDMSWQKRVSSMYAMFDCHLERMKPLDMGSDECAAYKTWVQVMSVQPYMKMRDAIVKALEEKGATTASLLH